LRLLHRGRRDRPLRSVSLIKPGVAVGDVVNDGFLGLAPKR
jgi:hypothetical protein